MVTNIVNIHHVKVVSMKHQPLGYDGTQSISVLRQ